VELCRSVQDFIANDVEPADLLLQRAMPLMERRVNTMQANVMGSLNRIGQRLDALTSQISDLTSGKVYLRFAGDSSNEQRCTEVPSGELSTSPSNSTNGLATASSSRNRASTTPVYKMSRAVKTLPDLWREWHTGLPGGYAIIELEEISTVNAPSWRADDGQFFYRRNRIINCIKDYAEEYSVTEETALNIPEQYGFSREGTKWKGFRLIGQKHWTLKKFKKKFQQLQKDPRILYKKTITYHKRTFEKHLSACSQGDKLSVKKPCR
jgi:hypothetical protein